MKKLDSPRFGSVREYSLERDSMHWVLKNC